MEKKKKKKKVSFNIIENIEIYVCMYLWYMCVCVCVYVFIYCSIFSLSIYCSTGLHISNINIYYHVFTEDLFRYTMPAPMDILKSLNCLLRLVLHLF